MNVSVTATPSTTYNLTVEKHSTGTGTGTVTGNPAGNGNDDINCGSNCVAPFNSGTDVTLTAVAAAGSHFERWKRCDTTWGTPTITVDMNSNKTCEAWFELDAVTPPCVSSIGVTSNRATTWNITGPRAFSQNTPAISATYSVSSTPIGPYVIFPGSLPNYSYTVTPAASQSISGCGGSLSYVVTYVSNGEPPTCSLSPGSQTYTDQPVSFTGVIPNVGQSYSWEAIDSDANPDSANNINPFVVTYSTAGTKTVKITQPSASPDPGQCTVVITTPPPSNVYNLSVTKSGDGIGTVTGNPSGNGGDDINCGSNCSAPFNSGSSTVLTAAAAAGSHFVAWSGCGGTSVNSNLPVVMNSAKTCNAEFDLNAATYILSVTKSGSPQSGTVTGNPSGNGGDDINCDVNNLNCSAPFDSGTNVTLTAVPATGWQFVNWSGCGTGTSSTLPVLMNANKTCDANFDPIPATNLSVTLLANPNQGTATFSSNLTASVGGTAQGTINYTFWKDCSYNGTSIAGATAQCGAHSCKFDGTNANPQSCAVQYSTPKDPALGFVIVERGTHAGNATVAVIVRTTTTTQTHLACVANSCAIVDGAGTNECSPAGSSCGTGSQTHLACVSNSCAIVNGVGTDECSPVGSSCGVPPVSHLECQNSSCVVVDGPGSNTCNVAGSSCTIIPPTGGTCTFTANPTLIPRGNSSTLSWSCNGTLNSCAVRDTLNNPTLNGSSLFVGGASGSLSANPATTTSYSLNCNSGAFTGSVTVRVLTITEVPPR